MAGFILLSVAAGRGWAQMASAPTPLQPFTDEVREVERALNFYGQPLSSEDQATINEAFGLSDAGAAVAMAEKVLDKHVLAEVTISAESRVDAKRGEAAPDLIQDGTRLFLVKVRNQAGVTAPLEVESPNSGPVSIPSTGSPSPASRLTMSDVRERWAEISLLSRKLSPPGWGFAPTVQRLSGLPLEYRILLVYSRDAGTRSATLAFNVGQGTQDLGFLNEVKVVCKIAASRSIPLEISDDNGTPTTASLLFRDTMGRVYPNPIKRLAPDFYFQPQVYRHSGETISLPTGSYEVTYTGGPEYILETKHFSVNGQEPDKLALHLQRWIDPAKFGWYSGDNHIHPAGCSHYENPTEGVTPEDMFRQTIGEHLNVGASLIWGPCFYSQEQFFRGRADQPMSTSRCLLHYDLEVSGFPSSHAGHLVLLDLKHLTYPNTKRIEDWPTWDLPILRWAKSQDATVGFAHSGWGLKVDGTDLPNYQVPGFDSIGANEYIVDVTYPNTVDFISAGDTPYVWELSIWYHTLNVGFRTKLSGETDFPCIDDRRVGEGRTYARLTQPLTYAKYIEAVHNGASYVSDGRSHLMDVTVNGQSLGARDSEVKLATPGSVHLSVNAAAYLDPTPRTAPSDRYSQVGSPAAPGQLIEALPYDEKPYWDIERARIGDTRKVPVEVIVNGEAVARHEIVADGVPRKLDFDVPIRKSSWIAVRILPSSHSNAMFVIVGGRPIRASRRSAEWCLAGVNQCWTQKSPLYSPSELPAAREAYEHAREVYRKLAGECQRADSGNAVKNPTHTSR